MKFDYETYFYGDLINPVGFGMFSCLLIWLSVLGLFQYSGIKIVQFILFLGVGLAFLIMTIPKIWRGLRLLKDQNQITYTVEGIVEELKPENPYFSSRHMINGDTRLLTHITVDGEHCYSVSLPGIAVGDEVRLSVLLNSNFVMECKKLS